MEITGEKVINAPRDNVFAALHDPAVLQRAIPGCQRFTQIDPTRYEAEIALKIGPVASTFVGVVTVFNVDPPMGYSLRGRADGGGTVGGADGTAHIALAVIDPKTTNLAYHLSAAPHGRVAEVATDILQKKARMLAAEFFSRLDLRLENGQERPVGTLANAAGESAVLPGQAVAPSTGDDAAGETAHWSVVEPPARATTDRPAQDADAQADRSKAAPVTTSPPVRAPSAQRHDQSAPAAEDQRRPLSTLGQRGSHTDGWAPAPRKRTETRLEDDDKRGIGKWILAGIGLLLIIILLSDGF